MKQDDEDADGDDYFKRGTATSKTEANYDSNDFQKGHAINNGRAVT